MYIDREIYIYIYIYTYVERERLMCIYIYICIERDIVLFYLDFSPVHGQFS